MADNKSYNWKPIENLSDDNNKLANSEIASLAKVWEEQKQELEAENRLQDYITGQTREWAIETGILEKVYTIDKGITQVLIEKGIDSSLIPHSSTDKPPEEVTAMINDHASVVEGLFDFVKNNRELSESYIKEMHSLFTRHQNVCKALNQKGELFDVPLEKGVYKKLPNNPQRVNGFLHEYCPPEQVATEMEKLVSWHKEHCVNGVSAEIEAAWLHHRFTQIHPFQDGNGRIARALATLVFLKYGWLPLVITRDQREQYLDALEIADGGDLIELIDLFVGIEKKSLIKALSISREVLKPKFRKDIIHAAKEELEKKRIKVADVLERAKKLAEKLVKTTNEEMDKVTSELNKAFPAKDYKSNFYCDYELSEGEKSYWFKRQIIETTKTLGYFANINTYGSWNRIVMELNGQKSAILISFHGIGHEYRGIIGVSACFFNYDKDIETSPAPVFKTLSDNLFQINYADDESSLFQRFENWLNEIIVRGLDIWRRSL